MGAGGSLAKSAASEVKHASTEEPSSAIEGLPTAEREKLTAVLEAKRQEHGQPGETGEPASGQGKDASVHEQIAAFARLPSEFPMVHALGAAPCIVVSSLSFLFLLAPLKRCAGKTKAFYDCQPNTED